MQEPIGSGADSTAVTAEMPDVLLPTQGRVQIVQLYGRQTLTVGEAENYRVRLAPGFAQPVEYQWDFGDGTLSVGNNVVRRYTRPGRYTITAIARNAVNADTARVAVVVTSDRLAPPPPTEPSLVTLSAPPHFEAGQIVWVTGIYPTRHSAENDAALYAEARHRAGVVSAKKAGTTQYYVVVGGYRTENEAVRARADVLRVDDRPLWLMRLSSDDALIQGARSP